MKLRLSFTTFCSPVVEPALYIYIYIYRKFCLPLSKVTLVARVSPPSCQSFTYHFWSSRWFLKTEAAIALLEITSVSVQTSKHFGYPQVCVIASVCPLWEPAALQTVFFFLAFLPHPVNKPVLTPFSVLQLSPSF